MASNLPNLSRGPSATWSTSSEPKDSKLAQDSNSNELPQPSLVQSASVQPLWKRLLTGDASAEHETQRGMGSRHIMMIGKFRCFTFYPPVLLSTAHIKFIAGISHFRLERNPGWYARFLSDLCCSSYAISTSKTILNLPVLHSSSYRRDYRDRHLPQCGFRKHDSSGLFCLPF